MSNTKTFAEHELDILVKNAKPDDRPIIEEFIPEILALVDKFGNSGQSGGSAPYVSHAISDAIKKLCMQQPICPITGVDEEWNDVSDYGGDIQYQNNRCSCLFKNSKDEKPYYLDAIVWSGEDDYDTFTGNVCGYSSRQYVKSFPFEPKTFYIDVVKEQLPEDWTEEPYTEGRSWYDTEEFEKTGIKVWHKDNFRYHIKDEKQLEEVFKYYDEYKTI